MQPFTFDILHIDNKTFTLILRILKIIKNLWNDATTLKPNKKNGVKHKFIAVTRAFFDKSKFKQIVKDPTMTQLSTLQTCLRSLFKFVELTDKQYKKLLPLNVSVARAHALPKIQKIFALLPKFRPIVDTTSTCYYNVGSYLSELLISLKKKIMVKDSFDASKKIKSIPQDILDERYRFASFDVGSLFRNAPLQQTIKLILDRVYNDN